MTPAPTHQRLTKEQADSIPPMDLLMQIARESLAKYGTALPPGFGDVKANGVSVVCVQCQRCGAALREVSKSSPEVLRLPTIDDFDPSIGERWQAGRHELWQERQSAYQAGAERGREERDAAWQAWYREYLASPAWTDRRKLVLKRANYMCEGCGVEMASEAHHLTYAHVGDELLW